MRGVQTQGHRTLVRAGWAEGSRQAGSEWEPPFGPPQAGQPGPEGHLQGAGVPAPLRLQRHDHHGVGSDRPDHRGSGRVGGAERWAGPRRRWLQGSARPGSHLRCRALFPGATGGWAARVCPPGRGARFARTAGLPGQRPGLGCAGRGPPHLALRMSLPPLRPRSLGEGGRRTQKGRRRCPQRRAARLSRHQGPHPPGPLLTSSPEAHPTGSLPGAAAARWPPSPWDRATPGASPRPSPAAPGTACGSGTGRQGAHRWRLRGQFPSARGGALR